MNERIKQLAEQAGLIAGNHDDYDFKNNLTTKERKFAELIVRECADLLETNGYNQRTIRTVEPESHDKSTEWMAGYEEAVKQYGGFLLKKNARLIKKHFGVEE